MKDEPLNSSSTRVGPNFLREYIPTNMETDDIEVPQEVVSTEGMI